MPSSGNLAGGDSAFLGARPMPEIKRGITTMQKLSEATNKKCLQLAINYLKGEEVEAKDFETLPQNALIDKCNATTVFTAFFFLFRAGLRAKIRQIDMQSGLGELGCQADAVQWICAAFKKCQTELEEVVLSNKIRFPNVDNVRWRVDVNISSSSMSFVLQPTILIELVLSNEKKVVFEMPPLRFHQLRYNVAKVLKEMEDLEKLQILKIDKV